MRVLINLLFLTSERLGGSWTYSTQLVKHLTSTPGPDRYTVLTNNQAADLLPVSPIAGERFVLPINAESRFRRIGSELLLLRGVVRKVRADILHSTGNTLPLGAGIPGIVTLHDLQYRHYPENFSAGRRLYLRSMIPLSLHLATKVICDSEYTKRDALAAFNIDERKLTVVYAGGLTEDEAVRPHDVERVRERYHLEGPYLLSVGSSLPHKNLDRMIQAFDLVAGAVPHRLVIVGPGFSGNSPLSVALSRTSLEEHDRVRRIGFVPHADLPGLYAAADGLVFPSLFEGFGIPLVEAMECGCPVICSRAGSLPEIVGDAGMLVDPEDVQGFADAMRRLCLDRELYSRLQAAGRLRVDRFSWARMAEDTRRVYHEVAGIHQPPSGDHSGD